MSDVLRGGSDIEAGMDRALAGARAGAARGIGLALNLMLQVSNKRVPHEEGDLERDGAVVMDEENLIGAVTYGNSPDTAKYAERQHEDMTYRHDAGRSAKFLEQARTETADKALAIIQAQVAKGMEDGK